MTRKHYPVIIFSTVLAVMLIVAVAWRYYHHASSRVPQSATTTPVGSGDDSLLDEMAADEHALSANGITSKGKVSSRSKPTKPALSTADAALIAGYSHGVTISVEEARWLQKYGYPTTEQAIRYQELSDGALSALAQQGDELAAITLATRQALAGGGKPPIAALLKIAAKGSVYALEQLAIVHSNNSTDLDDIVAQGYIEAMKLRGNYAPPFFMSPDGLLDTPKLTTRQQGLSQALGQAIIDRLNASRLRQGEPPFPYQPRPGASESFEQSYAVYLQVQELLEQERIKKNSTHPTPPPNPVSPPSTPNP